MRDQLIYKDSELARYYDSIYSYKDYKKEVEKIIKLILKYKKSEGKDLLEVACGTGQHLQYLKNKFSCFGIDMNEGVLEISRKKIPNVTFKRANMINFKFERQFDVISCLFSSIGYVKTNENLKKTINNFVFHLRQGGIVIIEPWFTKSNYKVGTPHMTIYDDKEIKIARLNVSEVKGNISVLNMHYLVAEKNKDVKYFVDRHELGMFGVNEILKIMKNAGLEVKFLKNGLMKNRGLFIGVKE